jgi:hypothetical protein
MPRLVLLYFEDNNDAELFVSEVREYRSVLLQSRVDEPFKGFHPRSSGSTKVLGSYMMPTKFCSCPGITENNAKSTEGTTFGLRIHRACGLPYEFSTSGQAPKNLLAPDKKRRDQPFWIYFYPKALLEAIK